ncbi:MAG: hypothetical protein SFW67_17705 [Myxococcaceae bacterium]|nr:hypothetical protein [Myxococcaceae bacterium]
MSLRSNGRLSRRQALKALSLAAAGTSLSPLLAGCRSALVTEEDVERGVRRDALDGKPRFLITIAAAGGASIIDSFLAVRASEAGQSAARLNTFPDSAVQAVSGSPFRAVRYMGPRLGAIPIAVNTNQLAFAQKYRDDMLVATSTGTSVNHVIAQKRAITGNAAWKGRTLQEVVALQWGQGFPLPNVNMAVGGYAERGTDGSLPASCYAETVTGPSLWPLGLDGAKGIRGAPSREVVELARRARNELDDGSVFGRTFGASDALTRWRTQRADGAKLEVQDLITKLNVIPDMPPQIPLSQYGLASSPDGARLRQVFPEFFTDPFEAQAALAFLLLKHRVSVAVTIGPDFNVTVGGPTGIANPPLAFDYSHNDHRGGQAYMWARILGIIDRLVTLLKAEPFDATESLWDRTMLYVATDFGRTRNRPDNAMEFGSGHDLNNGFLLMSPMVKGNTVLGGVDAATTMAYGFDARTGQAQPGKFVSNEPDIYSGVLTAMGADLSGSGLPDASAFKG